MGWACNVISPSILATEALGISDLAAAIPRLILHGQIEAENPSNKGGADTTMSHRSQPPVLIGPQIPSRIQRRIMVI